MIKLTQISVYPIKSTKGISLDNSAVSNLGLPYDRNFGVIDLNNKIITARENPRLLNIATNINNNVLELSTKDKDSIRLHLEKIPPHDVITVGIFKDFTSAIRIQDPVNDWMSKILQQPVRLVKIDVNAPRKMKAKYNAQEQDIIPFCDAAPLHLISTSSLADLNTRFKQPFTMERFRPNLVVEGSLPYEEENWKKIAIGNCIFETAVKTARCNFITIDPETTQMHPRQEPLRTLSIYKKENASTNFGIYLIPRKLGEIKKGDSVRIQKRNVSLKEFSNTL